MEKSLCSKRRNYSSSIYFVRKQRNLSTPKMFKKSNKTMGTSASELYFSNPYESMQLHFLSVTCDL